jgi:hypothetical protein
MRMNRVLTAGEIFQLFQNKGYSKLNPEKIRKRLLARKQKEEDIELSLKLMACIAVFNEEVFHSSNDVIFGFVPKKSKHGFMAGCLSGPRHGYEVFVEGLLEMVEHETQKIKLFLLSAEGELDHSLLMSQEQFFVSVAVHEVRHEVQKSKGFRMFRPEHFEATEGQVKHFIRLMKMIQELDKELYEKQGKSKRFISQKMSPREFDARFIESLSRDRVYRGISMEDLIGLARLQPP